MRRSRCEAVRTALNKYLERRNYTESDSNSRADACLSAEQMAVSAIVDAESGRANSILFSCINSDPAQCDQQFTKLSTYIKTVEPESVQTELSSLLCPLLCHMYLEMLRGGQRDQAQLFLKRHSSTLPHNYNTAGYNHQTSDGNLPSALYRPNSLEQLFHSLQNGTIDNEIPEKDFIYQILDELNCISSIQELESRPSLTAFRSCKYEIQMSSEAIQCLKRYLARHSHVILIQVLQTWFHLDIMDNDPIEENSHDFEDEDSANEMFNNQDTNDSTKLCNGHMEFMENTKDLSELHEAINSVREQTPPLKLFTISVVESSLTCATLDSSCKTLYGGFTNSDIRIWSITGNVEKDQSCVNRNISRVDLACDAYEDNSEESPYDPAIGICLRGHNGSIQALRLLETADKSGVLVSASQDTSVRAWRLSDKTCAAIYRGHNYPVWCLDVAKHGVYMASGSYDRTARLWSLDRTFPLRIFAGHNSDINAISFHPNGNYIATGSADKTVRLWCVSSGQQVRLFPGHRGSVHCVAFSPDGKLIASAGEDKRIKIWDIANGSCLNDLKGHQNSITNLDWSVYNEYNNSKSDYSSNGLMESTDPGVLSSTSMDSTVRVWDSHLYKYKGANGDSPSTIYNCKCTHTVFSRYYSDWLVAIGANVKKS